MQDFFKYNSKHPNISRSVYDMSTNRNVQCLKIKMFSFSSSVLHFSTGKYSSSTLTVPRVTLYLLSFWQAPAGCTLFISGTIDTFRCCLQEISVLSKNQTEAQTCSGEMCRSGNRRARVRAGRIMESSGREFACIGLPADNSSWRWSTDSSFTLAETLYLEKGLFLQTGVMSHVQIAGDKLDASPGFKKASLGSDQIYSCLFSSLFIKIRWFFFSVVVEHVLPFALGYAEFWSWQIRAFQLCLPWPLTCTSPSLQGEIQQAQHHQHQERRKQSWEWLMGQTPVLRWQSVCLEVQIKLLTFHLFWIGSEG